MTAVQIAARAIGAGSRKGPLIWALILAQVSVHLFLWKALDAIPDGMMPPAYLVVGGLLTIAALGITGVGGLAWTDDAVSAIRALRGVPEPPAGGAS